MSEKEGRNEDNPNTDGNGFVDQEWPPFKGSMAEEMSDEDRERYEKRLSGEAAEEEGEFGGEKNETFATDHGEILQDENGDPIMRKRSATGNPFDYTPRQEGESNSQYGQRLRWQKLMAEKAIESPLEEGDYRYKENGERDAVATEAAWRERVGAPTLAEYMGNEGVDEGTSAEDVSAEVPSEENNEEVKQAEQDLANVLEQVARKKAGQELVDVLSQATQQKAEQEAEENNDTPNEPFDASKVENPTQDDLSYEAWLKSNAMVEEETDSSDIDGENPDKPFDTRDIENPTQDDLSYEAWLRSNANPDQLDADGNPTGAVTPDKPFDTRDIENPTQDDLSYEAWLKSNANPDMLDNDGQPNLGSEVRPNGEDDEGGEYDPTKSRWSQMSDEEKDALIHKYPRNEGESTEDWAKRIEASEGHRIFGAEQESDDNEEGPNKQEDSEKKEDEEDEETRKKRLMRELSAGAIADWIQKEKGLTRGDLDKMSADELQQLIDEYEKSEGKEDDEALKKRLMRELSAGAIADWIQKEKGLTRGDLDKMSADELQKLIDEYNNRGAAAGGGVEKPGKDDGKGEGEPKEPKMKEELIVASIDLQKDAKDAARLIAQNMLAERLSQGNKVGRIIKGIVWGQMFREGVLQRYQKQAYEMIQAKQRGESTELDDRDWSGSKAGIERFVAAYVEGMKTELISTDAGEKMDVYGLEKDEDGTEHAYRYDQDKDGNRKKERLDDNSNEAIATRSMHDAIAQYAQGKLNREQFENQMRLIQKSLNDEGANTDLMISNYMNVAEAARDRYDHEESIESIMEGFTFINGEARRNVRTEAHRDALDKITERLSNSAIGRVLPPEVIGTAASLATNLGKSGLRTALISAGSIVVGATVAPAVVPVAVGMVTTGVLASIRERNRSTTDRETQARRMAQGESAGDTSYDERMERTQYEAHSAKAYTDDLERALKSGNADQIKTALASAEAATRLSDRGKIDLIRYSSGNTDVIEQERMDLAVQRAKAKAELKRQGVAFDSEVMTRAIEGATQTFEKDISAKDAAFRKLRRRRMVGQGVKSAAVAGVMSVASQEVVAMVSPKQYGIFDNVFHLKNNEDAQATLMAGALGLNKGSTFIDVEAAQGIKDSDMTPEHKQELEQMGYTVKSREVGTIKEGEVPASQYFGERGNSSCESWLDNGTSGSDGTELQGYFRSGEGPYTFARGMASGGGKTYDLSKMGDQIKFYMRATPDSSPIAINGMVNSAGEIVPDTSNMDSAITDMLRDRTFYQIQGGFATGVENGKELFASLWTFGGSGDVPDMIKTQVSTSETVWDVIGFNQSIERAVASFPALGAARRKNLTRGRRGNGTVDVRVPTGAKVIIEDNPGDNTPSDVRSGGETPPSTTPTASETPASTSAVSEGSPVDDGEQSIDYRKIGKLQRTMAWVHDGDRIIDVDPTMSPAEAVEAARREMENNKPGETKEFTASNNNEIKVVRPGEVELPNVLTEKYEMVDGDSYSTLVEISDGDLTKIVPENRTSVARAAIDRWNKLPVEMRRKYLLAESDEEAGMDADSLDVAKTLEGLGIIKSDHNDGKLAEGVKAAPEKGAHADALDAIDPDAFWGPDVFPDFKDTIRLYTDGDIRINVSDDQIRELSHNPVMSQADYDAIRMALKNWNYSTEEEQRKILANAKYHSSEISDDDLQLLEGLGLIQRESEKMTFTIRNSKGEAMKFAPSFERTVNNISAFRPESGRE